MSSLPTRNFLAKSSITFQHYWPNSCLLKTESCGRVAQHRLEVARRANLWAAQVPIFEMNTNEYEN